MSTRAQLLAEIAAQFPDNTTGLITPAKLRQVTEDLANSCAVPAVGDGAVSSADITDASASGRTVLTGTPAQAREAIGVAGDASNAMVAPYYVDSVAGDDTNSGRTESAPLKTIAALRAKGIVYGDRIYLKRGSYFREALDLYNKNGLLISDYGAGDPWVLDGSDNVPNAGFTVNGTYATIYQCTYAVPTAIGVCSFAVWEDDVALRPFTSLANLNASVTGGFYAAGGVLYVKAPDAGNVVTNGKTYSAHGARSYANFGCYMLRTGSNCEVRGGRAIKPYADGGAAIGLDSYVHDMTFEHGTKHHAVIGSALVQRCKFLNLVNPAWYQDSSLIAFYYNGANVTNPVVEDCTFWNPAVLVPNSAILAHVDGGGIVQSITVRRCSFENISVIFGLSPVLLTFERNRVLNCDRVSGITQGHVVYSYLNDIRSDTRPTNSYQIETSSTSQRAQLISRGDQLTARTGSTCSNFVSVLSAAQYFTIFIDGLFASRGEVSNGVPLVELNGVSPGLSLTIQNSTILDRYILNGYVATAAISSYSGYRNRIQGRSIWTWNSTTYNGLAAWKAASSSDATSEIIPQALRKWTVAVDIPAINAGVTVQFQIATTGLIDTDRITYRMQGLYAAPGQINLEPTPATDAVWFRATNLSSTNFAGQNVTFDIYADCTV